MIIHFSILAVILVMSLIYENKIRTQKVSAALETPGGYEYKSALIPWLVVFGYIAFLAGMRSGMNDTSAYVNSFNNINASWDNIWQIITGDGKDKGFGICANLFQMYISTDYHAWFFTFAIIESAIFIYVLRRECVSFSDACFYFFATTLYYNYFSMMRQWMAVSLTFLAYSFMKRGKFIPFLLICLLAAQFHNSAYLMIIVYFLVRGKSWGKKQLIFIGVFALAMLFLQPLLNTLETLTEDTTYDYAVETMNTSSGSSIIRPIIAVVPVVLAYIYRDKIKDDMMNLCVNMAVLNFMLNFLAAFTSGLYVIRLATYISIYNVILFPYLLNVAVDDVNRKYLKPAFYILYFAFYVFQMNWQRAFGYNSDILGVFS